MDKLNQPTTSSAPRSERDTPAGTNHSSMASARWEAPTGRRKIVPGVVIGVAVAALFVGMDYKFKHKAENTVDTPAVAQGPAVESMVNEAPTAARDLRRRTPAHAPTTPRRRRSRRAGSPTGGPGDRWYRPGMTETATQAPATGPTSSVSRASTVM